MSTYGPLSSFSVENRISDFTKYSNIQKFEEKGLE